MLLLRVWVGFGEPVRSRRISEPAYGGYQVQKLILAAAATALLASAGSAVAQDRYGTRPPPPPPTGCPDHDHHPGDGCPCEREVTFYNPSTPWSVTRSGGPGIRIYSRPVVIQSGRVDIQSPPIWVEAPPIRIAPTQIYLHAPDVHVRPSDVTVDPPEIHFEGCEGGTVCNPG